MSASLTSATEDVILTEQQPLKTSTAARNGQEADDSETTTEGEMRGRLSTVL